MRIRNRWPRAVAVAVVGSVAASIFYFLAPREPVVALVLVLFLSVLVATIGIHVGGRIAPPVKDDPWFKTYQPFVVGTITATITLFVAFAAWTTAQRQITSQQEMFQTQQRPWVEARPISIAEPLIHNA